MLTWMISYGKAAGLACMTTHAAQYSLYDNQFFFLSHKAKLPG